MSEVTVEVPKSVVEEVTKYECDKCGGRFIEEDVYTISITENHGRNGTVERGHFCHECVEAERYAALTDIADIKTTIGEHIDTLWSWADFVFGFALALSLVLPIFVVVVTDLSQPVSAISGFAQFTALILSVLSGFLCVVAFDSII